METLKSEISADGNNPCFKTTALETCFQYYYANHYGVPQEYKFEYKTQENGDILETVVQAIPCSGINYSNKEPKDLEIQVFPKKKTALLTIDSFSYYGKKNRIFFTFVDRAFSRIEEDNIENVILDLRGNGGGDPFCASYLWSYLEREPQPYFSKPYGKYAELSEPIKQADNNFSGGLYVLIDGSNFSTTGHFCSLLKYHGVGTFIGTETGSTYTCNAAVRVFPLKNTKIGLKIATGSFAAAVEGLPKDRGIIPDRHVKTRLEDMKAGKDMVLEYAFSLIENMN
jgi:C-terminal processing protease CtpA/Prc